MLRIRLATTVFILLFAGPVFAGPALPVLLDVVQPDGSRFKVRKQGDEYRNWTETDSGHTILRNKKTKAWEYAVKQPSGILGLSGITVSHHKQPNIDKIPKHLSPPRSFPTRETQQLFSSSYNSTNTTSVTSKTTSTSGDWVPAPVSGAFKVLIVLVNFSDRSLTTTPSSWHNSVFSTTAGDKSVANYYKDNSFDALSIIPVAHSQDGNPTGVVSVTIPYVHPNHGTAENIWVAAAINAAAAYVDFSSMDTNGNGYIDRSEALVYLIPAGYEAAGTLKSPSVWAHATTYASSGLAAAGKLFPVYAMNGELNDSDVQQPIGMIVHELGHQFCGLPDLYDVSGHNAGMGWFSPMAAGSWGFNAGESPGSTPVVMDVWSREYLGWVTPTVLAAAGPLSFDLPLSSRASAYKLVLPLISQTEYFMVENRYPSGWDLGLRGLLGQEWGGGLLITHNDITAGTLGNNDINDFEINNVALGGHQGVVPVQANTTNCNMLVDGTLCRGHSATLFYLGNNDSWGPLTTPNSNYYNGISTNFSLSALSTPAVTMTGNFTRPTALKTLAISIVSNAAGSIVGGGTVTGSGGISCLSSAGVVSGVCDTAFETGTAISLAAVPDAGSTFAGWSGGCTGLDACNITIVDDTGITATFSAAWKSMILNGNGYDALASAYAAVSNGGTILSRNVEFTENLVINKNLSLIGGFNSDFISNNNGSYTSLHGTLTVGAGSLVVDKLIIK